MSLGDVRVVADVPGAFASIVAETQAALPPARHLRLAASGSHSGAACFASAANEPSIDWSAVELYFVDERCVDPQSADANLTTIRSALGGHADELAALHPMSCAEGPVRYQALLEQASGLDLCQLGLGPDGHTASLFPDSPALHAPAGELVTFNEDPSGNNAHRRLTLTYEGIALARRVVIVVIGAEKRDALKRLLGGEDLPAAAVHAAEVLWLCDEAAGAGLVGAR